MAEDHSLEAVLLFMRLRNAHCFPDSNTLFSESLPPPLQRTKGYITLGERSSASRKHERSFALPST